MSYREINYGPQKVNLMQFWNTERQREGFIAPQLYACGVHVGVRVLTLSVWMMGFITSNLFSLSDESSSTRFPETLWAITQNTHCTRISCVFSWYYHSFVDSGSILCKSPYVYLVQYMHRGIHRLFLLSRWKDKLLYKEKWQVHHHPSRDIFFSYFLLVHNISSSPRLKRKTEASAHLCSFSRVLFRNVLTKDAFSRSPKLQRCVGDFIWVIKLIPST